jgi:hypothetical protein
MLPLLGPGNTTNKPSIRKVVCFGTPPYRLHLRPASKGVEKFAEISDAT